MSSVQRPGQERDPIYLVRAIGRMAQMLIEMRDEYIQHPTDDALDQIERRVEELVALRDQLRESRATEERANSVTD